MMKLVKLTAILFEFLCRNEFYSSVFVINLELENVRYLYPQTISLNAPIVILSPIHFLWIRSRFNILVTRCLSLSSVVSGFGIDLFMVTNIDWTFLDYGNNNYEFINVVIFPFKGSRH